MWSDHGYWMSSNESSLEDERDALSIKDQWDSLRGSFDCTQARADHQCINAGGSGGLKGFESNDIWKPVDYEIRNPSILREVLHIPCISPPRATHCEYRCSGVLGTSGGYCYNAAGVLVVGRRESPSHDAMLGVHSQGSMRSISHRA